ncbi:MAG: YlqD family protein [Vampirovibrionales bacterium]|nr:YlqD family protein [Vampirovibrionales bacterium]
MPLSLSEKRLAKDASPEGETVMVKRQVTVKTVVTDAFRERAKTELGQEVAQIDNQLNQLQAAYQQTLQQLEQLSAQGQNVLPQRQQLEQQAGAEQQKLTLLKEEVSKQLGTLDTVSNGTPVITGLLDSWVGLNIGDNIYEKVRDTVILVTDGVITAIDKA